MIEDMAGRNESRLLTSILNHINRHRQKSWQSGTPPQALDFLLEEPTTLTSGLSDATYNASTSILSILGITAIIGNLMVILTIATDKSLRNRPQLLLFLNLAIFDLIKGLEVFSFTVSSGFSRDYVHPPVGCIMAGFVHIQWQAASCISMVGIGYFRYEVVCRRNFKAIRKTKKAAVNIMVSWSASMIWATLPLLGWSRYILDRTGLWCHIQWEDPDLASNTFLLLTVSALFIFPTTLQGICYFRALKRLHSLKFGGDPRRRLFINAINRRRIEHERQVTLMCGLIVLLILLCELPYFVCAVIEMFILLPLPLLATISTMRDCTCAIKPIVFLTCSTQFRDGLFKMFEKLIRPRKAKVEDVVYGNAISLSRPRRNYAEDRRRHEALQFSALLSDPLRRRWSTTPNGDAIFVVEFNNATQKAQLREKKSLANRQKLLQGANSIPHCGTKSESGKVEVQEKETDLNKKKPTSNQCQTNGQISAKKSGNRISLKKPETSQDDIKMKAAPKQILVKELPAVQGASNDLHKDSESFREKGTTRATKSLSKTGMAGPELTGIFSIADSACENGLPGVGSPTTVRNRSLPRRQLSPLQRNNSVNRSKLKWYSHNKWSIENPDQSNTNND